MINNNNLEIILHHLRAVITIAILLVFCTSTIRGQDSGCQSMNWDNSFYLGSGNQVHYNFSILENQNIIINPHGVRTGTVRLTEVFWSNCKILIYCDVFEIDAYSTFASNSNIVVYANTIQIKAGMTIRDGARVNLYDLESNSSLSSIISNPFSGINIKVENDSRLGVFCAGALNVTSTNFLVGRPSIPNYAIGENYLTTTYDLFDYSAVNLRALFIDFSHVRTLRRSRSAINFYGHNGYAHNVTGFTNTPPYPLGYFDINVDESLESSVMGYDNGSETLFIGRQGFFNKITSPSGLVRIGTYFIGQDPTIIPDLVDQAIGGTRFTTAESGFIMPFGVCSVVNRMRMEHFAYPFSNYSCNNPPPGITNWDHFNQQCNQNLNRGADNTTVSNDTAIELSPSKEAQQSAIGLSIFPNPANDRIQISIHEMSSDFKAENYQNVVLSIVNQNGKVLITKKIEDIDEAQNIKLEIDHLATGSYYVILQNKYIYQAKQLVIHH